MEGSPEMERRVEGSALEEVNPTSTRPPATSSFWFQEEISPDLVLRSRLNKILYSTTSEFQHVQVVETQPFGKTLVLDCKTQSSQLDEFIYHESLVHPAMLAHPNPKTVVVDVSKSMLPEWGAGVTDDPRLELHYTDAHAFLLDYEGTFDVIVMDIADPIEAGPGYVLYTQEFYSFAMTKLAPGGVLVTQSGAAAVHMKDECFTVINNTLKSVFQHVVPSIADIPSFGSPWAFNMASNSEEFSAEVIRRKDIDAVDADIEARISGDLRFYDGLAHLGLFGSPKWLRAAIAEESRIMTKDNPVFMH